MHTRCKHPFRGFPGQSGAKAPVRLPARDLDTEAAGRPNPGTFARPPMRAAAASRPTLSRRPGSPSGVTSNAPDHHAPNAGSRRAFRPPDPLLEPQDVAVPLRRSEEPRVGKEGVR